MGVFRGISQSFINELSEQGRVSWDEISSMGALFLQKRATTSKKNFRKDTKRLVVGDTMEMPLVCSNHSAKKAHIKLRAQAVDQCYRSSLSSRGSNTVDGG